MKSSQEMTAQILRIEAQINSLNEQIADYEEKKALVERQHTELIMQNLSNEKPAPGPGDAFAKALDFGLRADALERPGRIFKPS